jgi:hypothetical protein
MSLDVLAVAAVILVMFAIGFAVGVMIVIAASHHKSNKSTAKPDRLGHHIDG